MEMTNECFGLFLLLYNLILETFYSEQIYYKPRISLTSMSFFFMKRTELLIVYALQHSIPKKILYGNHLFQ